MSGARSNLSSLSPPQLDVRDVYAKEIPSLAQMGRDLIRDLDPQNDLKFLRFRSKTHEIMISPCECLGRASCSQYLD